MGNQGKGRASHAGPLQCDHFFALYVNAFSLTRNDQKRYMLLQKVKAGGPMLSRQFQIFMRVVECGSFSRAAKITYMTPASVMKHINALEERLGLVLLERSSSGVRVTSAGKSLYEDGKKLFSEANNAVKKAQHIKNDVIMLRIGSSLLNPCETLTGICARYKEYFKKYKFSIVPYDDDKDNILSVIASLGERIDLLVGAFNSRKMHACAHYFILGSYRLCAALPAGHPLAGKKSLHLRDLHGERLMMVKTGDTELLDDFATMLKAEHPQITIEETDYYYDMDTFNQCGQKEVLLLTLDAWKHVHPGLVTVPLAVKSRIPYGILHARTPSRNVSEFLEIMKTVLHEREAH